MAILFFVTLSVADLKDKLHIYDLQLYSLVHLIITIWKGETLIYQVRVRVFNIWLRMNIFEYN